MLRLTGRRRKARTITIVNSQVWVPSFTTSLAHTGSPEPESLDGHIVFRTLSSCFDAALSIFCLLRSGKRSHLSRGRCSSAQKAGILEEAQINASIRSREDKMAAVRAFGPTMKVEIYRKE